MLRTHVGPLQAEPKPENKNVATHHNLSSRETQQRNLRKIISTIVKLPLPVSRGVGSRHCQSPQHWFMSLRAIQDSFQQWYRLQNEGIYNIGVSWITKFNAYDRRKPCLR